MLSHAHLEFLQEKLIFIQSYSCDICTAFYFFITKLHLYYFHITLKLYIVFGISIIYTYYC